MSETCPDGSRSESVRPPKYSPDEKYVDMKRGLKRKEREEKGFL